MWRKAHVKTSAKGNQKNGSLSDSLWSAVPQGGATNIKKLAKVPTPVSHPVRADYRGINSFTDMSLQGHEGLCM